MFDVKSWINKIKKLLKEKFQSNSLLEKRHRWIYQ